MTGLEFKQFRCYKHEQTGDIIVGVGNNSFHNVKLKVLEAEVKEAKAKYDKLVKAVKDYLSNNEKNKLEDLLNERDTTNSRIQQATSYCELGPEHHIDIEFAKVLELKLSKVSSVLWDLVDAYEKEKPVNYITTLCGRAKQVLNTTD